MALLAAGALGVHQLRYAIGFGHDSGPVLAAHGHAYLAALLPTATVFAVIAFASVVLGLSDGSAEQRATPTLMRLWLWSSAALGGMYVLQEAAEGALASGHPAGSAAVIGGGAWIGLALAVPVGLLVALGLRGADDAALALARTAAAPGPLLLPAFAGVRTDADARRPASSAVHARGPPLTSAG
jgi:hypothetical protein